MNKNLFLNLGLGLAACAAMSSCNLMHDDMEPCAVDPNVSVLVNFVYDYNMDHEDYFDRMAGSVYLYVFDENDIFLNRYEKNKVDLDPVSPDFSIMFDAMDDLNGDIKRGETYKFIATAQGSHVGYTGEMETPGFKLVDRKGNPYTMIPGKSTLKDYILKLYRDDSMSDEYGVVDYTGEYRGNDAMIDTVWTTKPDEAQVVTIPFPRAEFDSYNQEPDVVEEVKLPMMRITNNITVAITTKQMTPGYDPSNYDIVIYYPKGNGTIDFTGETLEDISEPLYYRALRKVTDVYNTRPTRGSSVGPDDGNQYAIYATFGVSRMKVDDKCELRIYDGHSHKLLAWVDNFSSYLAEKGNVDDYGNQKYDDPQEYLDRQFDFAIDIALNDDQTIWWKQVMINILMWAQRDNDIIL